jgi:hypothetical protein
MKTTRLSLLYAAGYLIPSGLALLLIPETALKLLFARGDYGTVFPRLGGALTLGLGLIVVQIIRYKLDVLYKTLVGVRVLFCSCWLALYLQTRDPFFLCLLGVVGFGVVLTSIALVVDARTKPRMG